MGVVSSLPRGTAVRWVGLALGGCLLAGLAGCQSLRSLAPQRNRAPEMAAVRDKEKDAGGQLASLPRKKTVGVLGGQVVDRGNRRRPGAVLQIAPLDGGPAFLATADENGYFLVQGLDPGKKYKLTARTRQGEDPLGGTTLASPPNVVVLIKLTEVLPANAPPLEGQPVPAEPKVEKDTPATPAQNRVREYDVPNRGGSNATGPARLGAPGNETEPTSSGANIPVRPEYITKEGGLASAPPMAQIRGPALPGLSPGGTEREASSTGLFNLPLKTLDGGSTTIGDHRGRLTLVYVFGGGSSEGGSALATLAELERQHRAAGLAVVAISSEEGVLTERAERLRFQASRLHARFTLLLDTDASAGTRKALDVHRLPTVLLLDEKGTMVWRAEGLDEPRQRELQRELQRKLKGEK